MYKKGFTLIELLLYLALLTIIMSAVIPFAWVVITNGAKNSTGDMVYSTGRYLSERIKYEIRNAAGINSVSATSISLSNFNASLNPTVISLTGGNVTIKQGTGAIVNLNPTGTTVSSLTFTNNTSGDNKTKNISFVFTVLTSYTGSRQEYTASDTLRSSAEIRSN